MCGKAPGGESGDEVMIGKYSSQSFNGGCATLYSLQHLTYDVRPLSHRCQHIVATNKQTNKQSTKNENGPMCGEIMTSDDAYQQCHMCRNLSSDKYIHMFTHSWI